MRKIMLITIATILLIATGCVSNPDRTINDDIVISYGFGVNLEEGRLYFDYGTDCLTFFDFSIGSSLPLCAAPNCLHRTEDCGAFFPGRNIRCYAIYRGMLYFWLLEGFDQISLVEANLNGTNRRTLMTLSTPTNMGIPRNMAIYVDGKVFFDTMLEELDDTTGELLRIQNLSYFDFETGRKTVLSLDRISIHGSLSLTHYHNNKVYFSYSNLKDGYDHETVDLLEYWNIFQLFEPTHYVLDLETMQEEVFLSGIRYLWFSGGYVTFNTATAHGNELVLMNLDNMEMQTVATKPDGMFSGDIWDGKLFIRNGFHAHEEEHFFEYRDIENGKTGRIVSDLPRNMSMFITGETSDRFIGTISVFKDDKVTQIGNPITIYIYKNDFYNGQLQHHVKISDMG